MNRMTSGYFGGVYKDCLKAVEKNESVPYYLRARLIDASRTVWGPNDSSSHGRFHFLFGVYLFLECAKSTSHIWDESFPESNINKCENHILEGLRGNESNKMIHEFFLSSESEIDDIGYRQGEEFWNREGMAALSCVRCVGLYLGAFKFDGSARTENDTDTANWDSAFYSSVAVAGGADWQTGEVNVNKAAQLKFWKWYVDQAIPQAFEQALQGAFDFDSH